MAKIIKRNSPTNRASFNTVLVNFTEGLKILFICYNIITKIK